MKKDISGVDAAEMKQNPAELLQTRAWSLVLFYRASTIAELLHVIYYLRSQHFQIRGCVSISNMASPPGMVSRNRSKVGASHGRQHDWDSELYGRGAFKEASDS